MFYPRLLHDYLKIAAQMYPDKKAIVAEDREITYSGLYNAVDALGGRLIDMGLHRGDRVIVFLDNSIETVVSLYGILKAGGTFIPLNSSVKAKALKHVVTDSGARMLITDIRKAEVVKGAYEDIPDYGKMIWIGDESEIPDIFFENSVNWVSLDLFSDKAPGYARVRTIDLDIAALIYTSGSTGKSKGVICSHRSMVSAAQSINQYIGNRPDEIILDVLPLSFDYGLYQIFMSTMSGATVILEKRISFMHQLLKKIEEKEVTGFPIVPTIVAMLLQMKDLSKYDLSSLRYITNTGAALPVEHIRQLRKIIPHVQIFSMFGLTECKRVSYLPPDEIDKHAGSVGKSIPNCEVSIVDEDGNAVPTGEIGELVVRGTNVMQGYWNAPELTQKVFRRGEKNNEILLQTGDFFRQDKDGYLYFIGRKDEMLKCKGERVSPKEIESVISEMPGVGEAAVIGVEDRIVGQAIHACVVLRQGHTLSPLEIKKYCSRNLEDFKIPSKILIMERLPKTANGKIDKHKLKSSVITNNVK